MSAGKLRYVVQKHTRPGDVHWDFMLEDNGKLLTWRLPLPPEKACVQTCAAVRIFDHPLRFLDYEGAVNNGTGSVEIADSGSYELIKNSASLINIHLRGQHFRGIYLLECRQGDEWVFHAADEATS